MSRLIRQLMRRALPVAALVAGLLVAGCAGDDPGDDLYSHLGGDFELTAHDGSAFRLSEHEGVSLLFFGFTSCPDVCPLTMSRLATVMDRVRGESVTVLFVSVDPRRDTPERLAEYVRGYDVPVIGLTADETSTIVAIARLYAAGIGQSSEGAIDHSSRIYLLDENDVVRDVFRSDDEIDDMVDRIRAVLD